MTKSATTNKQQHRITPIYKGWLSVWVKGYMGVRSQGEGHHSKLMFPTTTTTLFLPESRARMRDRVQENKEKNKIEE